MKKKNPPARLTHRWTFGCSDRSLQHKPLISSVKKGLSPLFFFNASRLSAQIDSSKKIKSSAINVCDICALCVFVHLSAIDACDDCVSV